MMSFIESFWPVEPFFQKVVVVCGVFFLLTVINLALTALFRIRNYKGTSTWAKTEAVWKRILVEAVYGSPKDLPRLGNKVETLQFIRLWSEFHEGLRGEASDSLNHLAHKLLIADRCLALLRNWRKHDKLSAIVALGHLREKKAFNAIQPYIWARHSVLSLVAARALVQIDADRALPLLLGPMTERFDWPDARLGMIFHEAGQEAVSKYLMRYLLQEDTPSSSRLIPFLKYMSPDDQMPAAMKILERSNYDATKVECLSHLQFPDDVKYAKPFISHQNPKFRKAAVEAFARLGNKNDIASLHHLAFDPNLGVRFEAIRSISRLDPGEADALSKLKTETDNWMTQLMIHEIDAKKRRVDL